MSTASTPALDMSKLNPFIGQFVTDLGARIHAGMVVIEERLGLYKALAGTPVTSAQLAAKTDTDKRYVRERLASQAAGGYVTYDEKRSIQPDRRTGLRPGVLRQPRIPAGRIRTGSGLSRRGAYSGRCELSRIAPLRARYGDAL